MNEIEAIRQLIANNETAAAIQRLMNAVSEAYLNELVLLSGRYSKFENDQINGIENEKERIKINNSLLQLLQKPDLLPSKEEKLEKELLPLLEQKMEQLIAEKMNALLPIGAIIPFAGTKIPDGWMLCDGKHLNIDEYRALYDVLATWNQNSERKPKHKHFFIPDLRGQFIRGARNVTAGIGIREEDATLGLGRMGQNKRSSASTRSLYSANQHSKCGHPFPQAVTLTGGGDEETRPKNYAVNFIIKVK